MDSYEPATNTLQVFQDIHTTFDELEIQDKEKGTVYAT